ncbi:MAG: hypothetical protein LCH84_05840 [Gemmatimonadetes bacterium]|nr:hypothetical protein [Gemmatimonadota bacterium]
MSTSSDVTREGISVGLIGALAIAVWFGIVDAIQGRVFATPIMLGNALGTLFLEGEGFASPAAAFLLYTVCHFAIFAVIGLVFAWVVDKAERVPSAFIGFAGLFIAFEVGWVGWTTVLAEGFGELTWAQVFVANIIGAAAMGLYMWRQHPALPARVNAVLAGAPE